MTMLDSKCDVCGRVLEVVGVSSSALGPISFGWCRECLTNGAEPQWLIEHTLIVNGGWEHVADWVKELKVFFEGAYRKAIEVIPSPSQEKIKQFWKQYEEDCKRTWDLDHINPEL